MLTSQTARRDRFSGQPTSAANVSQMLNPVSNRLPLHRVMRPFLNRSFPDASLETDELTEIRAKLRDPASPLIVSRRIRIPAVIRRSCFLRVNYSQFFGPSATSDVLSSRTSGPAPHDRHSRDDLLTKTPSHPCERPILYHWGNPRPPRG